MVAGVGKVVAKQLQSNFNFWLSMVLAASGVFFPITICLVGGIEVTESPGFSTPVAINIACVCTII